MSDVFTRRKQILTKARELGHLTKNSAAAIENWIDELLPRLELVEDLPQETRRILLDDAELAAHVLLSTEDGSLGAPEQIRKLVDETGQRLFSATPEIIFVPAASQFATMLRIGSASPPTLVVMDGTLTPWKDSRFSPLAIHEMAHARPEVEGLRQSPRGDRQRSGEAVADVWGTSLAGLAFPIALMLMGAASGRPLNALPSSHPSIAGRARVIRDFAAKAWPSEYSQELAKQLSAALTVDLIPPETAYMTRYAKDLNPVLTRILTKATTLGEIQKARKAGKAPTELIALASGVKT
jgi:hypothetical protein